MDQSTETGAAQTPTREGYLLRSKRRPGSSDVDVSVERSTTTTDRPANDDGNASDNYPDEDCPGTVEQTPRRETTAFSMNELVHWALEASPDQLLLHPIVQIALERGAVRHNKLQDGQPRPARCVRSRPGRWKTKAELKQMAVEPSAAVIEMHLPVTSQT